MDTDPRYLHSEITGKILEGFYRICNKIGYGFELEIYKRALAIEIETLGLSCEIDKLVRLDYKGSDIGTFQMDLLVDNKVIVKLTDFDSIRQKDETALINQLKMSDIEVGLMLNIHLEKSHKRKVYTNDLKEELASRVKRN
jgi:GxxExxY protein